MWSNDPDVRTMLRFQAGDADAFELLFRKYLNAVLNFCLRYSGDRAAAEDAAQETFLRLYAARRSYRPLAKFTTFLFQIATNLALNERRFRSRHPVAPEGVEEMAIADPPATRPDAAAESSDRIRLVREGVAALPDRQRAALLLVEYERMTYADVAAALDTTVPAVETLLFRARQALRSRFGPSLR